MPDRLKPALFNSMSLIQLDSVRSLKAYVGREIAVTEWLAITQDRIQQFADATDDHQWIHVDVQRARIDSPYGAPVAHGFLTLSLVSQFIRQAVQLPKTVRQTINYGMNRVRFPAPVRAGDKIRARIQLRSLREMPDCFEAIWGIKLENEKAEKPCCVAEWIVRYY